jgi:hypothetical protein
MDATPLLSSPPSTKESLVFFVCLLSGASLLLGDALSA